MDDQQITKGEQTRLEILAVAKRLFLSQGFTATPMRQIAGEVGITPAAIYNHYASKDHVFAALLQSTAPFSEVFALFDKMELTSPEQLIRQVVRASLAVITSHKDYLQLALIDAQERDGAGLVAFIPELLPRAQMWYGRLAALDAQAGDGRLRGVSFPVFLRTLIALLAGFVLTQHVVKPDRLPAFAGVDWPEALVDVFLYGVLRPPAGDVLSGSASLAT